MNKYTRSWLVSTTGVLSFILWDVNAFPNTVPTKFDFHGNPSQYMTKEYYTYFMLIMTSGLHLFFLLMRKYIQSKTGLKFINMPNKVELLKTEEGRRSLINKAKDVLALTGVFINLVFLASHLMIKNSIASNPSNSSTGFFLIGISVFSIIFLIFVFKISMKAK